MYRTDDVFFECFSASDVNAGVATGGVLSNKCSEKLLPNSQENTCIGVSFNCTPFRLQLF